MVSLWLTIEIWIEKMEYHRDEHRESQILRGNLKIPL